MNDPHPPFCPCAHCTRPQAKYPLNRTRMKRQVRRDELELEMTGFRIVEKLYSQVRDLFAEVGAEALLKEALYVGHAIDIDALGEGANPKLYFVVSEQQVQGLTDAGVDNPTFLQLLGTSEVIALTPEAAEARYRKLKE